LSFSRDRHRIDDDLWKAMRNQGYSAENIEIINKMYKNTRAYVHTDGNI